MEMNNELLLRQGDSVTSLLNWLKQNHYKIVNPVLNESEFLKGHYDIVAVPDS
jgi:hypothetical protein